MNLSYLFLSEDVFIHLAIALVTAISGQPFIHLSQLIFSDLQQDLFAHHFVIVVQMLNLGSIF